MIWGYSLPWYGGFRQLGLDDNRIMAGLKFNRKYGLKGFSVGLDEFADTAASDRDRILDYINKHDMHLFPAIGYRYVTASDDEARAEEERIVERLNRWIPEMRVPSVMTAGGKTGHRYDREIPLERRIELLSSRIAPLVATAQALDTPLGINNQGDYFVSDLVAVCKATPGLGIYLDTSNVVWVGEKPIPAYEEAAPYTVGTHWRDEFIQPGQTKPQRLELTGAVLGEGDMPLRECFRLLNGKAPDTKRMVMQIEMIKPKDMDEFECLERSLAFVRSLREEDA